MVPLDPNSLLRHAHNFAESFLIFLNFSMFLLLDHLLFLLSTGFTVARLDCLLLEAHHDTRYLILYNFFKPDDPPDNATSHLGLGTSALQCVTTSLCILVSSVSPCQLVAIERSDSLFWKKNCYST